MQLNLGFALLFPFDRLDRSELQCRTHDLLDIEFSVLAFAIRSRRLVRDGY